MPNFDFFLFGIMPYAVLAVALIGSIARYERDPFTWKSSSSQFLRRKQLMWGSVLFHVGIIVLFFGHLVGLFTPVWVLDTFGIPYALKQWMAVLIIRKTSTFADIAILAILWLQIVIGLGTILLTLGHMDGAEMVRFMTWSQSVMGLQINAWQDVIGVHWLYKTHIFLGLVIVALFPFTRLVHMLSVPIRYLWRPGYQIVRSRRTEPLRPAARRPHPAE